MSLATLLPARWRLPYALTWTAVALSLSVAALQDYHRGGGTHDWEPFLWEFSSVVCVAVLALGIHALVGKLRGRPLAQRLAGHAAGVLAYAGLHIAGMFGIRFSVYALAGVSYHPAGPWSVIAVYESAKDAVSYASFVLISRGVWVAMGQAELERALAEARLARLADQLQPHFLFNTLNLVSSVMYEDVPRADRLLCQLADLLRQTLAAQQRVMHTLADELALVAPFLALMQERFGPDRLAVRIEAEPAAQRCRLPALLLLAPVENAVKHDVARHRGRVLVIVKACCANGMLQVEVLNLADGPDAGTDASAGELPGPMQGRANRPVHVPMQGSPYGPTYGPTDGPMDGRAYGPMYITSASAASREGSGQGLRKLREQLLAAFGDRARVEFGPVAGGMRLALVLPAELERP